jgi:hypothetical protein
VLYNMYLTTYYKAPVLWCTNDVLSFF